MAEHINPSRHKECQGHGRNRHRRGFARPRGRARISLAVAAVLGLAAGFDKDGEVPDALLALGFGFAEVGSITPLPQAGNPKPRQFRLEEDEAVINRMGFNNGGGAAAAQRLAARKRHGIVGINIGANKDSDDRVSDYAAMTRLMAPVASYLAVNVSSPNTPGLRDLQAVEKLEPLLRTVRTAADQPPTIVLGMPAATFNMKGFLLPLAQVDAMPATLDGLLRRGFKFVTVSQLLAMKTDVATAQASATPSSY